MISMNGNDNRSHASRYPRCFPLGVTNEQLKDCYRFEMLVLIYNQIKGVFIFNGQASE